MSNYIFPITVVGILVPCFVYLWRTRWPYPGWAITQGISGNPPAKHFYVRQNLGLHNLAWSSSFTSNSYAKCLEWIRKAYALEHDQ